MTLAPALSLVWGDFFIGLVASVPGILVAIAVPLLIEKSRRPALRIERADDANRTTGPNWRIVHVKVINEPIGGRLGNLLLRNVATGCVATVTLQSRSDGKETRFAGKWSAKPQPITYITPIGKVEAFFTPEMVAEGITMDLSPGSNGQAVAIAIKHEGDSEAHAFSPEIYLDPTTLRQTPLALPDEEYDLRVVAASGEIKTSREFVLTNRGSGCTGLSLTEKA